MMLGVSKSQPGHFGTEENFLPLLHIRFRSTTPRFCHMLLDDKQNENILKELQIQ
jgi:hypothetical protein